MDKIDIEEENYEVNKKPNIYIKFQDFSKKLTQQIRDEET